MTLAETVWRFDGKLSNSRMGKEGIRSCTERQKQVSLGAVQFFELQEIRRVMRRLEKSQRSEKRVAWKIIQNERLGG